VKAAADDPVAALHAWEADALERIREMLVRGYEPGVAEVLKERTERNPEGPLVVYDAWIAWRAGDLPGAREILAGAAPADGPVGRDRAVLAARLAVEAREGASTADGILATIEADDAWRDRPQGVLDATTVSAARIRLAVDLDAELGLAQQLKGVRRAELPLLSVDAVLPLLARRLGGTTNLESLGEHIPIPLSAGDLEGFASRLNEQGVSVVGREVRRSTTIESSSARVVADAILDRVTRRRQAPDGSPDEPDLGLRLAALALRRWTIVTTGLFLARACDALLGAGRARDPQPLAIAGTLGAFVGNEFAPFRLVHPSAGPLEKVVRSSPLEQLPFVEPPPTAARLGHALTFLDSAADEWGMNRRPDLQRLVGGLPSEAGWPDPAMVSARTTAAKEVLAAFSAAGPALDGIGVYLLSPDPLDVLVRRVLGVPDQLAR
jgi:hypothetical protein